MRDLVESPHAPESLISRAFYEKPVSTFSQRVGGAAGLAASLVAIDFFAALVAFLRLHGQRRDGSRVESPQRDRFACLDTIAIAAILNSREGGFDFRNQLALSVARPKLDRAIGLGRGAVRHVGVILALVLQ